MKRHEALRIKATAEQLTTIDRQLHSTIFGFLYEKNGIPPVCKPEAVIRFLQLFIDLPEFRRICNELSLNEIKEFLQKVIYQVRMKFWTDKFGDEGNQIFYMVEWLYDHKFKLQPPTENLLKKVRKAIFWHKIGKVEVVKTRKENYFVPDSAQGLLSYLGKEEESVMLAGKSLMWDCLMEEFINIPNSIYRRIKGALPFNFSSENICFNFMALLNSAVIYRNLRDYQPALELYRQGIFPLGIKREDGSEIKTLLVLCLDQ